MVLVGPTWICDSQRSSSYARRWTLVRNQVKFLNSQVASHPEPQPEFDISRRFGPGRRPKVNLASVGGMRNNRTIRKFGLQMPRFPHEPPRSPERVEAADRFWVYRARGSPLVLPNLNTR